MIQRLPMLALLALGACAEVEPGQRELSSIRFAPASLPQGVVRSNADLAADFLDLTFQLESGEPLPVLLRYEAPIRVHFDANGLGSFRRDLDEVLDRLRREAGLDIAETRDREAAQIRIEGVPAAQIARIFPTAACFIVPGAEDWASFVREKPEARARWSDQTRLEGAAIFLPLDTTPQDLRDCLNEELSQALGTANDLYRLPDSVWNDDNFHGLATPFDMLMLRVLYQPELASGMTRAEVARVVPGLLDRLNPRGRHLPRAARAPESRAFAAALQAAASHESGREARLGAARVAVQIAAEMRPSDHRLGVALLALGRLELRDDPLNAARRFAQAYNRTAAGLGKADVRTAQAAIHLAALALGTGQDEVALALARANRPAALRAQNAVLVAGFAAIEAEALTGLDRPDEARAARLDSLRWARYAFGDEGGALAREELALARAASAS